MIAAEPKTAGQYQPYPEYKDSGVEWLGEVPTNWSVATLRHALAGIKNGSTATQLDEGIDTVQISRIETISTGEINHDKVGFVEFVDALHHYRLNVGDILFSHINSLPMVGNIAQYCSKIPLYHGMNLLRLQPSAKVESRYLYWWLKSTFSRKSVESLAKPAINQASIAIDQIKSIPCLYPMWDEQCIIAAFLDYETARIDRLIAKQQQLIELLKEKRQAVISHAVTKGLNPNTPMKDSGVEWLGQVPEHWEALPIKYVSWFVGTGGTPKDRDSFTDENEINWFTPGDFNGELVLDDSGKYVTKGSILSGDAKIYPAESVLIVGIGATLGKVGVCNFKFSCNQQINIVTPNCKIAVDFLAFSLLAQTEQMKQTSNASTIGIMNQEKTKGIQIAVPPVQEQTSLIIHLKKKLSDFSLTTSKAEQLIALLQERRTALISAAVTGKIDLRGWTPPAEEVAA